MKTINDLPLSKLTPEQMRYAYVAISGVAERVDHTDRMLFSEFAAQVNRGLAERLDEIETKPVDSAPFIRAIERVEQQQDYIRNQLEAKIDNGIVKVIASIDEERRVRVTENEAEALARITLAAQFQTDISNANALIIEEKIARASALGAEATQRLLLKTTFETAVANVSASVLEERQARTTAIQAEATARLELEARFEENSGGDVSTAQFEEEKTARANGDEAEASERRKLQTIVTNNHSTALALISDETKARSDAFGAEATRVTNLLASYETKTEVDRKITAGVSSEATARANAMGAEATRINNLFTNYDTKSGVDAKIAAKVQDEATARSDALGAEATRVNNLLANYDTKTGVDTKITAKVSDEATARTSAIGAEATRVNNLLANYDTKSGVDTKIAAKVSDEASARTTAIGAEATRVNGLLVSYETKSEVDRKVAAGVASEASARADAIAAEADRVDQLFAEYDGGGGGSGYDDTAIKASITNAAKVAADATKAVADRASSLEASAGAVDGMAINSNPRFAAWPVGQALPTSWLWWSTPGTIARGVAEDNSAYRSVPIITSVANVETGFASPYLSIPAGFYVMEAEVYLESGNYLGSGLTLGGVYNLNFSTEADLNEVVSATGPARRKFSKFMRLPDITNMNFHPMVNWTGFAAGGGGAKKMHWYKILIRTASESEAKAQKADAALFTPGTGLSAKVASHDSVIVDLPNNYTSASRTNNIESSLNDARSRLVTVETATTNGSFASASSVSTLRSDYNGTAATVSTQATTIADINYRTRAYWRSEAVAGNNRAQITMYADSNNGAGVDIIGDVTIRSKLEVGTGASGQRTEITNSGIRVYDGNNVLRVQLGVF